MKSSDQTLAQNHLFVIFNKKKEAIRPLATKHINALNIFYMVRSEICRFDRRNLADKPFVFVLV